MPSDNIVQLQIGNEGNLVRGDIFVDYTDNTISGPGLSVDVGDQLVGLDSLTLHDNGNGTYTIVGATASVAGSPVTSVNLTLGSQNPDSVTAAATTAGVTSTQTEAVVSAIAACYASGTLIATERGDVCVEDLVVGDRVVTSSGVLRPIKWIGHRVTNCRRHMHPEEAMPVRVAAHAFGENRPARDLFVSPGHAICIDVLGEILIPAKVLVNGSTIQQVDIEEVTYWHIELDSHDILIANGLAAESYLDMGNRTFFSQATVVEFDALPDALPAATTHADFCRPYINAGAMIVAVGERLRARAIEIGWTIAERGLADLCVVADGEIVHPDIDGLSARFVLPTTAEDVWLVSDPTVPSHIGIWQDGRSLGVCIKSIRIEDGLAVRRDVALDDPLLCVGFHEVEGDVQRWTAGRARLPASLWEGCKGRFFLRFDLTAPPLPRWVAPDPAAVEQHARIEPAEHPIPVANAA